MTYPQAINYLGSFINYEKNPAREYKKSFRLGRFRDFLDTIGNPQDSLKCLHIAGSKGKGSTCAFISYILQAAGFKTGLYTSPHLSDIRERIRILGRQAIRSPGHQGGMDFEGMISKNELAAIVSRLKPPIEKFCRMKKYSRLSFFEVFTAIAFVYFKNKKVDFVVLETGLGGRLDATNVVNPLVSVITPISYEHMQLLGKRLSEIAAEKAGIIKGHRAIVISAPQEEEAAQVIRKKCKQTGARLYELGKDIKYRKTNNHFLIKSINAQYAGLNTRLLGKHQLINAACAVAAAEALGLGNISQAVKQGLSNAVWPGRCEVILKNPLVVLDGAQNAASAEALRKAIKEEFSFSRLLLILGVSSDKDIKGICRQLYPISDTVILTKSDNPRAASPEILAEEFIGKTVYITSSVKDAADIALSLSKSKDLVLVTGSLFVVGEFRNETAKL